MDRQRGFTLIELLIAIAVVGLLAAVLVPNLLNARDRAFDTAAVSCLKQASTTESDIQSSTPFRYSQGTMDVTSLDACAPVVVATAAELDIAGQVVSQAAIDDGSAFAWRAFHPMGRRVYAVASGTGIVVIGDVPEGGSF